mgnify:CR=1 FL=1
MVSSILARNSGVKLSNELIEQRVKYYAETLGLGEQIYHEVGTYSKGMRQKIGIAISYAKNAKIYLLDEPASGLDPFSSNELTILLRKMSKKGATILMASHDIFRVRETCDKIGILKQGVLVSEMFSKDVTSSELESIYLDYMKN